MQLTLAPFKENFGALYIICTRVSRYRFNALKEGHKHNNKNEDDSIFLLELLLPFHALLHFAPISREMCLWDVNDGRCIEFTKLACAHTCIQVRHAHTRGPEIKVDAQSPISADKEDHLVM